jgi:hypothetical protein
MQDTHAFKRDAKDFLRIFRDVSFRDSRPAQLTFYVLVTAFEQVRTQTAT